MAKIYLQIPMPHFGIIHMKNRSRLKRVVNSWQDSTFEFHYLNVQSYTRRIALGLQGYEFMAKLYIPVQYLFVQSYTGRSALRLHGLRIRGKTLIQCNVRKSYGIDFSKLYKSSRT
jgi:hypothetical protein